MLQGQRQYVLQAHQFPCGRPRSERIANTANSASGRIAGRSSIALIHGGQTRFGGLAKADVNKGKPITLSHNAPLPQAAHSRAEAALAKFKRPYG